MPKYFFYDKKIFDSTCGVMRANDLVKYLIARDKMIDINKLGLLSSFLFSFSVLKILFS